MCRSDVRASQVVRETGCDEERDVSSLEGMRQRSAQFEQTMAGQLEEVHYNLDRIDGIVNELGRERLLWEQLGAATKSALQQFEKVQDPHDMARSVERAVGDRF